LSSRQRFWKVIGTCAGVLAASTIFLASGQVKRSSAQSTSAPSLKSDRIIRYIREKFGVPESSNMSLQPFQSAAYPGFYRTTVVVDDGKDKKTSTISVSGDGRYLILSDFLPLGSNPQAGIVKQLTDVFKLPANVKLSVGPFTTSPYAGFVQTAVTADNGERQNKQTYFVTRDKRFIVVGGIFNMGVDPRQHALRTMKLADQPFEGAANAPVTIVEYADLECPSCALEHRFLMNELLPHYGDKVKVVFKEFPLVQIHTWAYTAAIANECAFQIDPSKYAAYRTTIFDHQNNISATTARDLLLYYGQQVGLDRLRLAACVDSKASLPRVEAGMREGQELGVDRTPTFFINGQILIGGGPKEAFFQAVDDALRASR
jgi:protein-disulfide isomerase